MSRASEEVLVEKLTRAILKTTERPKTIVILRSSIILSLKEIQWTFHLAMR